MLTRLVNWGLVTLAIAIRGGSERGTMYCEYCQRDVATERRYQVNNVGWLLLSIVTCGIVLPVWGLDILLSGFSGQRCRFCGHRVR